jgi:hypothetical protein
MRHEFTPKDVARFWSHVDRSGGPDACWPWLKATKRSGYGVFGIGPFRRSQKLRAHRVAFYLTYGRWPTPQGLHSCDNPACCNPAHIFEGTQTENIADMVKKGRQQRGERQGRAKLTESDVRQIRQLWAEQQLTHAEIARRFGIGAPQVSRIGTRKRWKHVT